MLSFLHAVMYHANMNRKYTKRDWLPQAIGLLILLIVAGITVPCDGKSCDNPNTHYTE